MQGRNGDADIENRLMDTEGRGGRNGDVDIENRLMDTEGRGGRRELRYMEKVTWKLTLSYVKQIANGSSLYDSGNSNRGSVKI